MVLKSRVSGFLKLCGKNLQRLILLVSYHFSRISGALYRKIIMFWLFIFSTKKHSQVYYFQKFSVKIFLRTA